MKKLLISILGGCLFLSLATPALPWGSATHAYIATRIGKILPLSNANEIYGSIVPDFFNYVFNLTSDQIYWTRYYTHGIPPDQEGFMEVWRKASWWGFQKSLAYGYVAHNDLWGADYTAHYSGLTVGGGKGYVIFKSELLLEKPIHLEGITPFPTPLKLIFASLGITKPVDQLELAHNLFECAGDIYLAQKVRFIGERIITASLLRSDDILTLLTRVFGSGWKDLITKTERDFRQIMILYGTILSLDQETAIKLMANQMAQLAIAFLQAKGITPPSPELATTLAEKVIRVALDLCSDYMTEVEATVTFVKNNLKARGIWY